LWRSAEGSGAAGDTARLVAVIHRPKYDDWSLPKGKLDPGEDDEGAALREIHEETAHRGEIISDLGEICYETTKRGSTFDKVVRYFAMRVVEKGDFAPNDEVDELRWLPIEAAASLVSYDRDREVLTRFETALERR
jgi:8-oxo-dGTP diphosphatase